MKNHKSTNRTGFTLTELMVSIVIIAILASVTLYAMASVQTLAKEQRSKAQISKIHELIAERWQSYEERIPKLEYLVDDLTGQEKAYARLNALRELMKLEMPDRVSDVLDWFPMVAGGGNNVTRMSQPGLHRYYVNFASSHATGNWTTANQGAECLYMILTRIEVGDASALEMFSESEIGDTDSDGMPEILDAWNRPINFVRWAPGFASPMQPGDVNSDQRIDQDDLVDSRDVFDYARIDPRTRDSDNGEIWSQTFTLFPLIFSSGADGEANILRDVAAQVSNGQRTIVYRRTATAASTYNPNWSGSGARSIRIPNDPFVFIADTNFPEGGKQLGEILDPMSQGHIDNLYNHLIETSTN